MARLTTCDDALVTSIVPYGESDCIARLFTRQAGRIAAFCKRGLAIKKDCGAIQALSLARVEFISGHDKLSRLVSHDLDPRTPMQSSSLRVFAYTAYLSELIEKFLAEADPAPVVFTMIEDAFFDLGINGARPSLLRSFELNLLDQCGYLPELPSSEAAQEAIIAFDPMSCRFISNTSQSSWAFSYKALKLAKSMLIAKVGSVNYEESSELLMVGRIFQSRLRLMGVGPLKSVAFLKQLSR